MQPISSTFNDSNKFYLVKPSPTANPVICYSGKSCRSNQDCSNPTCAFLHNSYLEFKGKRHPFEATKDTCVLVCSFCVTPNVNRPCNRLKPQFIHGDFEVIDPIVTRMKEWISPAPASKDIPSVKPGTLSSSESWGDEMASSQDQVPIPLVVPVAAHKKVKPSKKQNDRFKKDKEHQIRFIKTRLETLAKLSTLVHEGVDAGGMKPSELMGLNTLIDQLMNCAKLDLERKQPKKTN